MARKMANRCIPDSPRYVPTPVVAATFDQHMEVVRRQCEIEPGETNCLAGHVRLELRNVVPNYPFERSHGFPGSWPISGHRDYSRLSCGVQDTQLRPSARTFLRGCWSIAEVAGIAAILSACFLLWTGPARSDRSQRGLGWVAGDR